MKPRSHDPNLVSIPLPSGLGMTALLVLLTLSPWLAGCGGPKGNSAVAAGEGAPASSQRHDRPGYVLSAADTAGWARAIFAAGCFWCAETAFEGTKGVKAVISGYVGGKDPNPTYEEVSHGRTGHAEAVLVAFDPDTISYERLLEIFWKNHDPTTADRQFCDRGRQYRPGIFYLDEEQKRLAEASIAWLEAQRKFQGPILTEISPATPFWPAEEYHQDFYLKNPTRYTSYRAGCGRDARLAELWGGPAAQH